MPKTLEMGKKKWEDKMKIVAPKWKKHVTEKGPANYAKNLAAFLGVPETSINPEKLAAYKAGIERVSEEDFAKAVAGKGAKWAERFKDEMTTRL